MEYDVGMRSAPPNGSRLSCGACAGGRKELWRCTVNAAGAQTDASLESRPRQLQAHVRRRWTEILKRRRVAPQNRMPNVSGVDTRLWPLWMCNLASAKASMLRMGKRSPTPGTSQPLCPTD